MTTTNPANTAMAACTTWPSQDELLRAALDYASKGLHVFPLKPGRKEPATKWGTGGEGERATANPDVIRMWWNQKPYNVGVACKPSGLVLLDIDVKDGKDGRPLLEGKDLTGAVVCRTPSGGLHYYWKANGLPFMSKADRYFDITAIRGVDIKADDSQDGCGGMAVLPPSFISDERPGKTGRYQVVSGSWDSIGPVPKWLVDLEIEAQKNDEKNAKAKRTPEQDPELAKLSEPIEADDKAMEAAARDLDDMEASVSGNGGHNALLKAATLLVVGHRLGDDTAFDLLMDRFNPRCEPPWKAAEVWHKIHEARANKLNLPWGYRLAQIAEHEAGNAGEADQCGKPSAPSVPSVPSAPSMPLRNYTLEKTTNKKGETVDVPVPRGINEIVEEVFKRFDGFPKRLGERLFHYDAEKGEGVREIVSAEALSAWLQGEGGCKMDFCVSRGFVTKGELFERLLWVAERFDAVSAAPHWPPRKDVFYTHGPLPAPTPDAKWFWGLLDWMKPASPEDRALMAAYFLAGMFYDGTSDRPAWAWDTVDAQASGKSTVPKVAAHVYRCIPIGLNFGDLAARSADIKKRLVSSEGRQTRFAVFDNVTSTVRSASLAELITSSTITERAAYGRGETSRPNDLVWTVTLNGGRFDSDAASRFYVAKVAEPKDPPEKWKSRLFAFIDEHRGEIWADMIGLLERAAKADAAGTWKRRKSRFPEFDAIVLRAVCRDRAEFDAVDAYLTAEMADANDDRAKAEQFEAAWLRELKELGPLLRNPLAGEAGGLEPHAPLVVYANDVAAFIASNEELQRLRFNSHDIRGWIKSGLLPNWSKTFRQIANAKRLGVDGSAAFLYGMDGFGTGDVGIVRRQRDQDTRAVSWRVCATIRMLKPRE